MKIIFEYDKEKDIWCLLNKGKSSNNSKFPTRVYKQLVAEYGEDPSSEATSLFVDKYISLNNISISDYIIKYQNDWDSVADEYHNRAEKIFSAHLPSDITAYLTINTRCPYNIGDNNFFATFPADSARSIVMHELWHFYTWYGLGIDQEEKIGKEKYNELKESLTVLLNLECADLLGEGVEDHGYPQHVELRKKILDMWKIEKDIHKLWQRLV